MESPVGRIVAVSPGHATVSVDATAACERCASGKGCGAGLLAGRDRMRLIEVHMSPGIELNVGDEVRLTLAPSHLLRAAFLAYGLPLFTVVIALAAAWFMAHELNDAVGVLLAVFGLIAGVLIGRHFLNRDGCLKNFVPAVSPRNA